MMDARFPYPPRNRRILLGFVPLGVVALAVLMSWNSLPDRTEAAAPPAEYWVGEYFNFYPVEGLEARLHAGSPLPKPVLVRNDQDIDFDWGSGSPAPEVPRDRFSVQWTRTVRMDEGTYRFHLRGDDGIRLFVNGSLRLDRWVDNRGADNTVDVTLPSGDHKLKVEYYENWGNALARLWWEKLDEETGDDPRGSAPSSSTGASAVTDTTQPAATPEPTPSPPDPAVNLVANGGFEAVSANNGEPEGWMVSIPDSEFGVSTVQPNPPEGSAVAAFPANQRSYFVFQDVEVRQKEVYEFSANVNVPSASGWFRLVLTLIPLNEQDRPLATYDQATYTQPTSGWVQMKNSVTMPSNTARVRIQAKVDSMRANGYLDDVHLHWKGEQ